MRIRKAVFPVGGLGTRFLPATKSMPKEMLPIVDKPLIHYAFEEARAAGIEQFIFVTGRNKDAIENHFDVAFELDNTLSDAQKIEMLERTRGFLPPAGSIVYTRQGAPLGLGHAVWCARDLVGNEPFAVILADDLVDASTPCIGQLMSAHTKNPGSNFAAVMDVPREKTNRYGILQVTHTDGVLHRASSLIEKPAPEAAPSTTAIIGRYVLQPGIFTLLEKHTKGAGGEIQLTDAMNQAIATTPFYGVSFEGTRYDCGEVAGFVEATNAFYKKRQKA